MLSIDTEVQSTRTVTIKIDDDLAAQVVDEVGKAFDPPRKGRS